uniref:Uncharacterized protein n=1 Tax=Cyanothece sp. (strain PCC 7425 / ATCC 29141) TaxID=395961 RepID=B8HYD0_CYAP4
MSQAATYVQHQEATSTGSIFAQPTGDALLTAARTIYDSYCQTHNEAQRPLGVAIDRQTQRGHLIFTGKPVLLPRELFVSVDELEKAEES